MIKLLTEKIWWSIIDMAIWFIDLIQNDKWKSEDENISWYIDSFVDGLWNGWVEEIDKCFWKIQSELFKIKIIEKLVSNWWDEWIKIASELKKQFDYNKYLSNLKDKKPKRKLRRAIDYNKIWVAHDSYYAKSVSNNFEEEDYWYQSVLHWWARASSRNSNIWKKYPFVSERFIENNIDLWTIKKILLLLYKEHWSDYPELKRYLIILIKQWWKKRIKIVKEVLHKMYWKHIDILEWYVNNSQIKKRNERV